MLPPQSRALSLDLLRALAVLLVVGHHVYFRSGAHPLLAAWHRGGWVGVDLFFVLSGFLVSGLLFREYLRYGTVHVGRFLVRRGLKIYPAFYCFLLATLAALVCRKGWPPARRVAGELLFVQNYLGGVWNHTWSLAVEEHFYLGIALLVAALARRPGGRLGGLAVALAALAGAALAARYAGAHLPYSTLTHLHPTHLRADALGLGVLLSYFYHFHHGRFVGLLRPARHLLWPAGLACLGPAFAWPLGEAPHLRTVGLSLFSLAWGMVLVALLLSDLPPWRALRALGYVGAHSYSIYLWHMPVLEWAVPLAQRAAGVSPDPLAHLALATAGSVGAGILAARLVEVPVLRLRDRVFPSRSGHPAVTAPPAGPGGPGAPGRAGLALA